MTQLTITLPTGLTALPVRTWLRQTQHISNSQWRRIKNSGTFRLNGIPANATRSLVQTGDVIAFESEKHPCLVEPENLPLDICYEDAAVLVVNKPAGQIVHPLVKEPHGTLGNAVLGYYARTGQQHGFHPVHRLDRQTTGLVLIAKEPQVQYQLSRNGQQLFHRAYLALIPGALAPASGSIALPLGPAPGSYVRQMVTPQGKPALTYYRTLRTGLIADIPVSLVELTLATGRTHQIRVHLAHLGHPLLGDDFYGGDTRLLPRQALHAYHLTFTQPLSGETINLTTPLPADMAALVAQIRD